MPWLTLALQLACFIITLSNKEPYSSTLPEENRETRDLCLIEGDIVCDWYRTFFKVAALDRHRLWTKRVVPYKLDTTYNDEERGIISEAMENIQQNSCIRFKIREDEEDYLLIERGNGCYSSVGRAGGSQIVSLNSRCFLIGVGTVIHELLHALGFWHEQNRHDRNNYVRINGLNIIPGLEINFKTVPKEISDLQDLEYDYASILHYGPKTFALDPSQDTITPLNLDYVGVIGQRKGLSELDIQRLNLYYKCDVESCEEPPALPNGYRIGNDFSVGQKVSFDCEEDCVLVGSKEAFCKFDGTWSGLSPSCKRLYTGHDCNFTYDLCGLAQDDKDDFDWTRINGGTPSSDTGPTVDHTTETSSGFFIYIETSEPRKGQVARIITPTLKVHKQVCLTFYYYMWGQTLGSLHVYIRYYNRKDVMIWRQSGDSVPEWRVIKLAFQVDVPVQVVFEGVVGPGSKGNIALDDIVFEGCQASTSYEIPDVNKPDPPDRWKGPDDFVFRCDFEDGICGTFDRTQAEFDWWRKAGPTDSFDTGPTVDHTLGTAQGIYLHLETSYPRMKGEKARFVLPLLEGTGDKCVSFYFHMYGEDMGHVRVILKQYDEEIIWEETGNKGDLWREAKVVFTVVDYEYQIIFEGVCGPGTKGDAAIDDIIISDKQCSKI